MPPPSTIYGHVASALGGLPRPDEFQFALDFRFTSRSSDLEHQQIITAGGNPFTDGGQRFRTSVQAIVQPHLRDFLYKPKLTLYLTRTDWAHAFRSPVFCVVLGRSQDLACVTSVTEVELVERDEAYFEHTLLPFDYRPYFPIGATVLMPRRIDPPPGRQAYFDRFIALHQDRVFANISSDSGIAASRKMMGNQTFTKWWVDTESPCFHGAQRGVVFHSFV
jgi:CRISPR-associated protein Cas5t